MAAKPRSGVRTEQRDFILLCGMSRESRHWGNLPSHLSALPCTKNVYCLDLPGCGKHWRKRGVFSIEAMREHVEREYLKMAGDQKSERKVVIGLSLGGMVAFDWVIKKPWEFTEYILINTSFGNLSWPIERVRPSGMLRLIRGLFEDSPDGPERAIIDIGSQKHGSNKKLIEEYLRIQNEQPVSMETILRQTIAALFYFPIPKQGLAPKGLILASRNDRLVNYHCSQRIAQHYGLELDVHPSAGHDLPLDDPHWVLEKVASHCCFTEATRRRA